MEKKGLLLLLLCGLSGWLFAQNRIEFSLVANKQSSIGEKEYYYNDLSLRSKSLGLRFAYAFNERFSFELSAAYTKRQQLKNFCIDFCGLGPEPYVHYYPYSDIYTRSANVEAAIRLELFRIKKIGKLQKLGIRGIRFFTAMGATQIIQIRRVEKEYRSWTFYPPPGSPFQIGMTADLGMRLSLFKRLFLDSRLQGRYLLQQNNFYLNRFHWGPELALGFRL